MAHPDSTATTSSRTMAHLGVDMEVAVVMVSLFLLPDLPLRYPVSVLDLVNSVSTLSAITLVQYVQCTL